VKSLFVGGGISLSGLFVDLDAQFRNQRAILAPGPTGIDQVAAGLRIGPDGLFPQPGDVYPRPLNSRRAMASSRVFKWTQPLLPPTIFLILEENHG